MIQVQPAPRNSYLWVYTDHASGAGALHSLRSLSILNVLDETGKKVEMRFSQHIEALENTHAAKTRSGEAVKPHHRHRQYCFLGFGLCCMRNAWHCPLRRFAASRRVWSRIGSMLPDSRVNRVTTSLCADIVCC